ncbi:MAG: hypothetical protein U0U70_07730 [Chitinophagaceae bacterium]
MIRPAITRARNYLQQVNWPLLLFLVLVLNVKMIVKLAALVLFLLYNRKRLSPRLFFHQRFTWFYAAMIGLVIINTAGQVRSLSDNYLFAAAVAVFFWLLCIAAAALTSWYVKTTETEKLHATLTVFFLLNIAVTAGQLLYIIIDSGSVNPYRYQGMYQKYFINTGDRITGIVLDVSTTNALICSFGLVYFLSRNRILPVLLSMAAMLLTTSNFANLLLVAVLLILFIFQSTRPQKSLIVVCLAMLVFFLARVTPQNDRYVRGIMNRVSGIRDSTKPAVPDQRPVTEKPDSILGPEEKRKKIALLYLDSLYIATRHTAGADTAAQEGTADLTKKPGIPQPSIHSAPFQRRKDTSDYQRELFAYGEATDPSFNSSLQQSARRSLPGKALAFRQTVQYFRQHPLKIITGTGAGNFSSKLAFRATGLRMAGGYPKRFVYTHPDFVKNHLDLFLVYFSRDQELHSLINTPNAVYDQLLAEYGLAGIGCFFFLYLGFFKTGIKRGTYGLPLLLLLLGAFGTEYWFEQLSVVILFELMMLVNIRETGKLHE